MVETSEDGTQVSIRDLNNCLVWEFLIDQINYFSNDTIKSLKVWYVAATIWNTYKIMAKYEKRYVKNKF